MNTYDSLIRVSKTNGRTESAESTMTIADQRRINRAAILAAGGMVGRELKALDVKGFTAVDSPVYREALARVKRGESTGLAVAYSDRLARNWRKVGRFYDELEDAGAEVIIAGLPGVDYRTAQGRQITGLMAVMSEGYYHVVKERGDNIANATVARGVPNRVSYGYRRNSGPDGKSPKVDRRLDGKALVPDKHTAPVVKRIFKLRAGGESWTGIADTLNNAGVPSPTGKQWTVQTLCGIVANETYLGVVVLGERRHEGAHKPLVTPAQWRAAQVAKTVTRNGRMISGLAGAVLVCSGCGKPMRVGSSGGNGGKRLFYGCKRHSADGPCPAPTNVSKDAADAFVDRVMAEAIEGGDFELLASAREIDAARQTVADATAHRKAWHKVQGTVRDDEWREEYEQRQQAERQAADAYEQQLAHAADVEDLPSNADAWHALDVAHQRRVARSLIDAVVVAPPKSRSRYADVTERFTVRKHGR